MHTASAIGFRSIPSKYGSHSSLFDVTWSAAITTLQLARHKMVGQLHLWQFTLHMTSDPYIYIQFPWLSTVFYWTALVLVSLQISCRTVSSIISHSFCQCGVASGSTEHVNSDNKLVHLHVQWLWGLYIHLSEIICVWLVAHVVCHKWCFFFFFHSIHCFPFLCYGSHNTHFAHSFCLGWIRHFFGCFKLFFFVSCCTCDFVSCYYWVCIAFFYQLMLLCLKPES